MRLGPCTVAALLILHPRKFACRPPAPTNIDLDASANGGLNALANSVASDLLLVVRLAS